MAKHKSFTVDTKVQAYFCDPQSPWQRGTNEDMNGLLRQYFPKKIELSGYSQAEVDKVALQLNQRPRKTLGFETPARDFKPVLLLRPIEAAPYCGNCSFSFICSHTESFPCTDNSDGIRFGHRLRC